MSDEDEITKSLLIESQIWLTDDIGEEQVVTDLEQEFGDDYLDFEELVEEPAKNRPRVVVIGWPNLVLLLNVFGGIFLLTIGLFSLIGRYSW